MRNNQQGLLDAATEWWSTRFGAARRRKKELKKDAYERWSLQLARDQESRDDGPISKILEQYKKEYTEHCKLPAWPDTSDSQTLIKLSNDKNQGVPYTALAAWVAEYEQKTWLQQQWVSFRLTPTKVARRLAFVRYVQLERGLKELKAADDLVYRTTPLSPELQKFKQVLPIVMQRKNIGLLIPEFPYFYDLTSNDLLSSNGRSSPTVEGLTPPQAKTLSVAIRKHLPKFASLVVEVNDSTNVDAALMRVNAHKAAFDAHAMTARVTALVNPVVATNSLFQTLLAISARICDTFKSVISTREYAQSRSWGSLENAAGVGLSGVGSGDALVPQPQRPQIIVSPGLGRISMGASLDSIAAAVESDMLSPSMLSPSMSSREASSLSNFGPDSETNSPPLGPMEMGSNPEDQGLGTGSTGSLSSDSEESPDSRSRSNSPSNRPGGQADLTAAPATPPATHIMPKKTSLRSLEEVQDVPSAVVSSQLFPKEQEPQKQKKLGGGFSGGFFSLGAAAHPPQTPAQLAASELDPNITPPSHLDSYKGRMLPLPPAPPAQNQMPVEKARKQKAKRGEQKIESVAQARNDSQLLQPAVVGGRPSF